MLIRIDTPPNNERGPLSMENALAAMGHPEEMTFELAAQDGQRGIFLRIPDHLEHITNPIRAQYPSCTLTTVPDDALESTPSQMTTSVEVTLTPDAYAILRHSQFRDVANGEYDDPLSVLLQAVGEDAHGSARLQIRLQEPRPRRIRRNIWTARYLASHQQSFDDAERDQFARRSQSPRRWPLLWIRSFIGPGRDRNAKSAEGSTSLQHDREALLSAMTDKSQSHLFAVRVRLIVHDYGTRKNDAKYRLKSLHAALQLFAQQSPATFQLGRIQRGPVKPMQPGGFLLSAEEVATLVHPPTQTGHVDSSFTSEFAELEPPQGMSDRGVVLGQVRYRDNEATVALDEKARLRHLYIVGKTGQGKTTLLENMMLHDLKEGSGLALLDPHDDLAASIISRIPRHRTNDVVVFDPCDDTYPIGFNPLLYHNREELDRTIDDLVTTFDHIYDLSSMPRMRDAFRNALLVLMENQKTLLCILKFFSVDSYREQLVANATDDIARLYWQHEWPALDKHERSKTTSAIMNKVRPLLSSQRIRQVLSQQGKKTLSIRSIMDEGKVLIARLPKGKLGEANARLLGALLVNAVQQAAISRANVAEADRRPFHLYVDEFQNFVTESISTILSEARKYGLSLTVAHQFIRQVPDEILKSVFGNIGSMVAFNVGFDDAQTLARQFSKYEDQVRPENLANLPKYTTCTRLLIDGTPSKPFTMATLPVEPLTDDRTEHVYRESRHRHGQSVEKIRDQIQQEFAVA